MTAADSLRALLTADWQPALEVQGCMLGAGYTVDETRTARRKLGVTKDGGGVAFIDGHWRWRLPPDGCPRCGRPWGWDGYRGDYWADDRPSDLTSPREGDANGREPEPPAPFTPAPRAAPLEPHGGPPRCTSCGQTAALPPGSPCCYWPGGRRCHGVLR
jgi:hypothetical protein